MTKWRIKNENSYKVHKLRMRNAYFAHLNLIHNFAGIVNISMLVNESMIKSQLRDNLRRLPVREWIQYKLCTLVSKYLCRTGPSSLVDMHTAVIHNYTGRRQLHSVAHHDLIVPLARCGQPHGTRYHTLSVTHLCRLQESATN